MIKVKEMINRSRRQKITTSTSDTRQSVISQQSIVILPREIIHLKSADLLNKPCPWCMENKIDKQRNAEPSHPSERFLNGAESGCGRCLLVRAGILKPMELEGVRLEESRTPHTKEFFEHLQKAEVDWLQLRSFTKIDQCRCESPMVGTHRALDGTRRSRVDGIVVDWVRECVEKHDCQTSTATLPSRVLDLSQSYNGVNSIRERPGDRALRRAKTLPGWRSADEDDGFENTKRSKNILAWMTYLGISRMRLRLRAEWDFVTFGSMLSVSYRMICQTGK